MFCQHCGQELPDIAVACFRCGAATRAPLAAPSQQIEINQKRQLSQADTLLYTIGGIGGAIIVLWILIQWLRLVV
jgi:uncharacterized membrane protein YvbJ